MVAKSEKKVKITKRIVESSQVHPDKRLSIWDSEIQGFNVRLYPTGRKVYYLQYWNKQKVTRKVNIGVHGNITTERARDVAQQLALKVSAGFDPAAQVKEQKTLPAVDDLCQEYMELHAKVNKRGSSVHNDILMIQSTILPALGNKKLEHISPYDLQKLHKDLKATPYQANRVRSLLSKMFALAIEWGWCSENPALFIKKYQEAKRTRWLDDEEVKRLWAVLDDYQVYTTLPDVYSYLSSPFQQ